MISTKDVKDFVKERMGFSFCKKRIVIFTVFAILILGLTVYYYYVKEGETIFPSLFWQIIFCFFLAFVTVKPVKSKKISLGITMVIWILNTVLLERVICRIGEPGIEMSVLLRLLTFLFILAFLFILWGIIGNAFAAMTVVDLFFVLFALVNYFVMKYRGDPIVPSDLFSVGTLSTVVSTYTISFTPVQLDMLLWLIIAIEMGVRFNQWNFLIRLKGRCRRKKYILASILSVVFGVLLVAPMTNAQVLKKAGTTTNQWDRKQGYYNNGPVLNFMANLQYVFIQKPDNYSTQRAKEILEEYPSGETQTSEKKPNIIMIMNESLADFSQWEDNRLTFDRDPLPFIHSLTGNTIKGKCYVSIFGSGTSNTEMEALTGHSMAFFPSGSIVYQIFPQKVTKGIVSDLKKENYTCTAIHPFTRGNWNRDRVYESMEFDTFLAKEDFENPEHVRWISDQATYDKIIELYEGKEAGSPMFVFDVTMQGHGGYETQTQWSTPVRVEGENFPLAEEYLSSTYVSDQAFSNLIHYFESQEEPTVICMFGDHQPSVEESFYEKMMGKSLNNLSLEEMQKKYVTPYVLWANYDIQEQNKDISASSLRTLVKEEAGLSLSSYEQFIKAFHEEVPIMNANGFRGKDGTWYEFDESSPYDEWLEKYRIVQYYIYCEWEGER